MQRKLNDLLMLSNLALGVLKQLFLLLFTVLLTLLLFMFCFRRNVIVKKMHRIKKISVAKRVPSVGWSYRVKSKIDASSVRKGSLSDYQ